LLPGKVKKFTPIFAKRKKVSLENYTPLKLLAYLLLAECLFSKDFSLVGFFPGEVKVVSPEVSIAGSLPVDGAA